MQISGGAVGGVVPGHIHGLTISNNATDATNDIDIAPGQALSSDETTLMVLASAITKRLDAAWAVGSGNGGLDTGSIANGTYHVHLIQRPDTGVEDVLFSTSPTAPTLPTNYTKFRRIASFLRVSGAILAFKQYGDMFKLFDLALDRDLTTAVSNILIPLSVPTGIKVAPILVAAIAMGAGAGSDTCTISLGDGDVATATAPACRAVLQNEFISNPVSQFYVTDTAAQVRFSLTNAGGRISTARILTHGWFDGRGQ